MARGTINRRALYLAAMAVMIGSGAGAAKAPGAISHDATKPIDVAADRLEVSEAGKTARFAGDVRAQQGDLVLQAQEVKVYYRADKDSEEGLISRIDANGEVMITTPGEAAHGDWAIYDVDRKIVTLGGTVSVERGENVIRGQRLVLDLDTGTSRIEGAGTAGERVRGTFVPTGNVPGEDGDSEND